MAEEDARREAKRGRNSDEQEGTFLDRTNRSVTQAPQSGYGCHANRWRTAETLSRSWIAASGAWAGAGQLGSSGPG